MMAPSAINKQPWKFYILTNFRQINECSKAIRWGAIKGLFKQGAVKAAKTLLSALTFPTVTNFKAEEDMVFHGAPVVVFITAPKDNEWAALDIGMCSQNIMLAAKSLGIDSCPIGMAKYVVHTKFYSELGIPEPEIVHLAIVLGYGAEQPEVHKRLTNKIIYINPDNPNKARKP